MYILKQTLKNPFKPHSKGNFWSVDLKAVPRELLLCQNTQVSRGAEHRFAKDVAKVFDLTTGLIICPVPASCLLPDGKIMRNPGVVIDQLLREPNMFDTQSVGEDKPLYFLHDVFETEDNVPFDITLHGSNMPQSSVQDSLPSMVLDQERNNGSKRKRANSAVKRIPRVGSEIKVENCIQQQQPQFGLQQPLQLSNTVIQHLRQQALFLQQANSL